MQTRLPQLDALRGIAILLVMFHNQSARYPLFLLDKVFANGWMGVDLFFVLSGFLITGILLGSKHSEGYFKNFYARRCLRIWPLYYSLLFFMFVVIPWLRPAEGVEIFARSSPWWAYLFFVQNLVVPDSSKAVGLLGVSWSLAIEEQFYLVWPLVVRFCSPIQLRRIALAVICCSPFVRLLLLSQGADLYSHTLSRIDGLMAGGLLASTVHSADIVPSRFIRHAWTVFLVALPLAFIAEARGARWIVFSLSAAASVALVYLALHSTQKWFTSLLSNRFLIYTGTISYGLYMLHKVPFNVSRVLHLDEYPLIAVPVLFGAAYGAAVLSWNFLEKPFLRLKRFF